jgi:hypothetical protein
MLRMLESQAPAKQTATVTISTLCSRLNNATLLEDRRAAILGLRSFAKEYPASVASGSLRSLIGSLTKDLEDVDTIKVVLETLLMLFNPNAGSLEAGEEIAFWLADEFTQHQDNIKTLLDLLETSDFYSRLYVLQLLTAIYAARPERTQESVLGAALGTSRLVSTLEDPRDAVRNAGLVFLGDLTQSSVELQKLVAFEGTFDRVFSLLNAEGGLQEGGIIVQDCLDLLANLVRQNSSNQSLFRESGCVPKLAELLQTAYAPIEGDAEAHTLPNTQRDKNIWGLLAVIRLFLVSGSVGTNINQKTFEKHGLLQQVLDITFKDFTEAPIRAEALYTCADMIRGNPDLQAGFAQFQVPLTDHSAPTEQPNGTTNGIVKVYVIDALLDLVIAGAASSFNIRLAACECIKAYFTNHTQIRLHFLKRAIDGYMSGEDETANVLTTLMRDGSEHASDPYKIWFAAVIILHLVWDDNEAKAALMKVSEGDAENGEEVVTCIQTLAGNLVAGIQQDQDERVLIAYLMLLSSLIFENPAAVDDFLGEASLLQALIQTASSPPNSNVVVKGLCALLIGILYEYSTKDSPIPRRKLQPLLTSSLGRERYLQALNHLRQHPLIRDFEVFEQGSIATTTSETPPYAYFDAKFIEFLKDNFSRFSRAVDRDPGIEIHPTTGDQGVDRDVLDTLRAELEEKNTALNNAESRILELEQKTDQAVANSRKEIETTSSDLQRAKQEIEAQQKSHAAEVSRLEEQYSFTLQDHKNASSKEIAELQDALAAVRKSHAEEATRTKEYYERTIQQGRTAKTNADARLAEMKKTADQQTNLVIELRKKTAALETDLASEKQRHDSLSKSVAHQKKEIDDITSKKDAELKSILERKAKELTAALAGKEKEMAASYEGKDKTIMQQFEKKQKAFKEAMKKLETELNAVKETSKKTISDLNAQLAMQSDTASDEKTKVSMLEKEVSELEAKSKAADKKLKKAEKDAKEKEEARAKTQTELDDLFLMLQDLEEKRARDKVRFLP